MTKHERVVSLVPVLLVLSVSDFRAHSSLLSTDFPPTFSCFLCSHCEDLRLDPKLPCPTTVSALYTIFLMMQDDADGGLSVLQLRCRQENFF
jgi:hypothetical protein